MELVKKINIIRLLIRQPAPFKFAIESRYKELKRIQNEMVLLPIDLRKRSGHVAIHMDNYILVLGGSVTSLHVIFMYNIYTEQWRKYVIPEEKPAPPATSNFAGAVIANECYLFGGLVQNQGGAATKFVNALWKLTKKTSGYYSWKKIQFLIKMLPPAPRYSHNGWEVQGKLWIFGGVCESASFGYYLNIFGEFRNYVHEQCVNNQLLCFNPCSNTWTNPKCTGMVPSPRAACATAIIGDMVWFYGGYDHNNRELNELYELNMESLSWTQVQTGGPKPQCCSLSTLTAITESKLVLHGGSAGRRIVINEIWILDLPSKSWEKYESSKDEPRYAHTASLGINKSIIIIGGLNRDDERKPFPCIEPFTLRLEPKSLEQLAMKSVYNHQNELPLNTLPKKLLDLIRHRNSNVSFLAIPIIQDTYIHQTRVRRR